MYVWLWRALPGRPWLKVLQLGFVAAAALALLFGWIFPWIDGFITYAEPSIGVTPP